MSDVNRVRVGERLSWLWVMGSGDALTGVCLYFL